MRARLERHSTRLRLFVTHLVAILIPLGALALFLFATLPARYTNIVAQRLRVEARLLRPAVEHRLAGGRAAGDLEPFVRRLGAETRLRITVIGSLGQVLGESERDPAAMESHATRPEFTQAKERGEGQATRYSRTLGTELLYVALLLPDSKAVLRLATPLRELDSVRGTIRALLLGSVLTAAVLALIIAGLMGRGLTVPLAALRERVDRLALGDLDTRVRPEGSAETRRLGEAFNQMAAQLQDLLRRETEDRSRYETILTQMMDGIVLTDSEGRVEMFNPAAGRMLVVAPQQMIGRSLLAATLHSGLWELLERSLRARSAESREVRLPAPSGRVLRVHSAPILGPGGRLAGGVLVLQDQTEARKLEEMRRDFVANVSHELKSPVAALRALADTLLLRGRDRPDLAQDYAQRIVGESERMNALLADLLDLAAIESGRREWRPERVQVRPLVEMVAERYGEVAAAKSISLISAVDESLHAFADGGAVEQALANLVENALKYSPEGAVVNLSATENAGEVLLTVGDTGPGIPPEALPRLFERFYRVDAGRGRNEGGTGLGLSIAKHLVEAQGGRIWVESRPGAGSRFTIALPSGE